MKADESLITVQDADGNQFYDGPTYFWKLAEIVNPNNDSMIETERNKLKSLNIKDFGYSVIKMTAEFKNIQTRVEDLGGTYSTDEQFLDFWNAMKTMKEKEFAHYVKNQKDEYRETPRNWIIHR